MVASVGATLGMLTTWPSRPTSPSPTMSPTRAVMTGMPAATSAPKVNAMMTMAAARPMASLLRSVCLGQAGADASARLHLDPGLLARPRPRP